MGGSESDTIEVRVLFFAFARELAGKDRAVIQLPRGALVGDAVAALAERFPSLAPALERFRLAVDCEFASLDTALHDGAELAVIPPVSGG